MGRTPFNADALCACATFDPAAGRGSAGWCDGSPLRCTQCGSHFSHADTGELSLDAKLAYLDSLTTELENNPSWRSSYAYRSHWFKYRSAISLAGRLRAARGDPSRSRSSMSSYVLDGDYHPNPKSSLLGLVQSARAQHATPKQPPRKAERGGEKAKELTPKAIHELFHQVGRERAEQKGPSRRPASAPRAATVPAAPPGHAPAGFSKPTMEAFKDKRRMVFTKQQGVPDPAQPQDDRFPRRGKAPKEDFVYTLWRQMHDTFAVPPPPPPANDPLGMEGMSSYEDFDAWERQMLAEERAEAAAAYAAAIDAEKRAYKAGVANGGSKTARPAVRRSADLKEFPNVVYTATTALGERKIRKMIETAGMHAKGQATGHIVLAL